MLHASMSRPPEVGLSSSACPIEIDDRNSVQCIEVSRDQCWNVSGGMEKLSSQQRLVACMAQSHPPYIAVYPVPG